MQTSGAHAAEGGGGGKSVTAARVPGDAGQRDEGTARTGEPVLWWWPRRRSIVLDACLALVAALECVVEGLAFADRIDMAWPPFVVLGFAAGSTLLLRRRWPVAVVLVSLAVAPAQMGVVLGTVSLYTLAASSVPRRITFSLAGMTTVGTLVVTFLDMHGDQQQRTGEQMPMYALVVTVVVFAVGLTVAPLLLGLYIGARRRLVESLMDRADGLERELSLLAEKASERARRARIEERTRIAREMHDVVAHRVSLMVVHAGALQSLALRDPEKAARNAELVGNMGRQALDELRTMLGVLRANEDRGSDARAVQGREAVEPGAEAGAGRGAEPAAEPGGGRAGDRPKDTDTGTDARGGRGDTSGGGMSHPAGAESDGARSQPGRPGREPERGRVRAGWRAPALSAPSTASKSVPGEEDGGRRGPGIDEVAMLVAESRAAGMTVELSVEGEERPLAAESERTAYRVVQEALTNVHKHAPGAEARVRVAYRPDEIAVLVENGPSDGRPSVELPSGGNGLVGMRERVVALGGAFSAHASDGGGFRVSAMLPDGD